MKRQPGFAFLFFFTFILLSNISGMAQTTPPSLNIERLKVNSREANSRLYIQTETARNNYLIAYGGTNVQVFNNRRPPYFITSFPSILLVEGGQSGCHPLIMYARVNQRRVYMPKHSWAAGLSKNVSHLELRGTLTIVNPQTCQTVSETNIFLIGDATYNFANLNFGSSPTNFSYGNAQFEFLSPQLYLEEQMTLEKEISKP